MAIEVNHKFREELARRLTAAREHAGLSQGAAARLLGVTQASVSHYEHGNRSPSVEVLALLVEIYHCDYGDLLP